MSVPGIIIVNVILIYIFVKIISFLKKDQHPYNPKGVDDYFASIAPPKTTVLEFKTYKPRTVYKKGVRYIKK